VNHAGQPTVILAKTIKGYGMGEAGEAQNITHQQKKMGTVSLKAFRDRFAPAAHRRAGGQAGVHQPRPGGAGDPVHARTAHGARRLPAAAPAEGAPLEVPALSAFERS
jgi:pyruvate dehydrogenase E1 component